VRRSTVAFSIKKGDLVYAADGTLGFVSDVFRPKHGDPDAARPGGRAAQY
jgi:hypothetical protein